MRTIDDRGGGVIRCPDCQQRSTFRRWHRWTWGRCAFCGHRWFGRTGSR